MASPSVASFTDASWSDECASEDGDARNVENFAMCSFEHHACSPILRVNLQEEWCKVALTSHSAVDVLCLCTE